MSQPTAPSSQNPPGPGGLPGRTDYESVLATRQELGSQMEPALVDSFASQVTDEIRRQLAVRPEAPTPAPTNALGMVVALVSVVMLIPITAIVLHSPAPWMMWLILPTILGINAAYNWSRKPR
ncbi:hypothetical protein [Aestuariimicrobium ganziense]|uniref:hypothetical protein n=1 Tax=Aestuariimicrobium ganziense TaxID=2773677 RepID=UPI001941AB7C|nr:hypothetical protein [Aestuariimicrobium ganziense]